MENTWDIESIYELQFFNCPSCIFKDQSKQEIINHAYEIHPESIESLKNIKDKSLMDVVLPWNENIVFELQNFSNIKSEIKEEPQIKDGLEPLEDMVINKTANPWNIQSIYELQFFNCTSCIFKSCFKQEIVNHAYEIHPESIECLKNIKDESHKDVMLPWNENITFESQNTSKIKTEIKEEPQIKGELDEDFDIIPFESEHISNIKIEVKNEALIREEMSDDQNPKYHVHTLDGKLCEHGLTKNDPQNEKISPEAALSQFILQEVNTSQKNNKHPFHMSQHCLGKENYVLEKEVIMEENRQYEEISTEVARSRSVEKNSPQIKPLQEVNYQIDCDKMKAAKFGAITKDHIAKSHGELVSGSETESEKLFSNNIQIVQKHPSQKVNQIQNTKLYKCGKCEKAFDEPNELKMHFKNVHEGNLKTHVKAVHEGVNDHVCNHCGKNFYYACDLKLHIKIVHEGVKDHVCNHCGKSFSKARDLKRHVSAVHEGVKDHVCIHCEKSFLKAGNLKRHVKAVHDRVKDHVCHHCETNFSSAQYLKKLVKTVHEGVTDHTCNHCGKSFTTAQCLKNHVKAVHEGVKDHVCGHCGKSFSQAGSLKTHVKAVHEGVKDHVCNQCGKSFSRAGDLKAHVKVVHEGVKDQICNHCDKSFTRKDRLNSHVKAVHGLIIIEI